ncbi:MAG TPA: heterodisulfide reductase-related iron-sulfur binding cluster [Alphaproteobacteria bacterium]|jgi:glycerol-3-phosphate dehydrogenase subunit C
MTEGGLGAPTRHPVDWTDPDFYDEAKLEAELRRVFDICHGCRRCFNLCDSFPRLFDLIDESETGELDSVAGAGFKHVVDACTLCDMCFMTKCPYVPPHEFNLDFPHLMLRYRAVELRNGRIPFTERQLTETDRNGRLAGAVAPLANWAVETGNMLTRPVLAAVAGIDTRAELPKFHGKTFTARARESAPEVNAEAPAHGRKAVLYATCFVNYNNPATGEAARAVLARNGVETEVAYPGCCAMPQLEHGDLARVAAAARRAAAHFAPYIDKGYDVVALTPSCALMLKFEWPLIVPKDDPAHADVVRLAEATRDIAQYVVEIADGEGLADGMEPIEGGITLHLACHARAQNIGPKSAEMLRHIPGAEVSVIERCSGHGGSWGVLKRNFETALKVGRPVARRALEEGKRYLVSECPLAAKHVVQGMRALDGEKVEVDRPRHPIEIMARAYGIAAEED